MVGALLAFVGYSLLNVGQGIQKAGLEKAESHRLAGWSIWTVGTLSTSVSVLVVLAALSVGKVSVVGAMAGSGLVSLLFFSALVLKERLGVIEVMGTVTIVAGSALLGLRASDAPEGTVPYVRLWGLLAVFLFSGLLVLLGQSRRLRGFLLAAWAGVIGGSSTIVQKAAALTSGGSPDTSSVGGAARSVLSAVTSPLTFLWIGLSLGSFAIIQFAYKRAPAIQTIPAFSVAFIAAPVVGGVLVYNETLGFLQWLGLAVVIAGVIVLSRSRSVQ